MRPNEANKQKRYIMNTFSAIDYFHSNAKLRNSIEIKFEWQNFKKKN